MLTCSSGIPSASAAALSLLTLVPPSLLTPPAAFLAGALAHCTKNLKLKTVLNYSSVNQNHSEL